MSNGIHKSCLTILASALLLPASALALGTSATAQSDDEHCSCSNRTLSGDYGAASEGVLLPPAAPSETQFRSVGVTHFDGKGNFTGVEHTVIGGMSVAPNVDWTENSGTYNVNANCTGKLVINTPNSPISLTLFFVIVRHGTEFHTVLDSNAISTTYIKVGLTRR